jgi:hypothetical protein
MLLYGGDIDNIEPIHRLLNAELDRRKFGLVIIRVCRINIFKLNLVLAVKNKI